MHTILMVLLRLLAFYLGLTSTFFTLSYFSLPTASFYARLLASYGCLLLCATYGVIASLALRLVGKHRISQWTVARAFHYTMAWTTGIHFEIVSGQDHLSTRPCVLIGNHQSELDVLLLGAIFPPYCSVTAKRSLRLVPFLGWFMALSGTVFIDRSNFASAHAAFDKAAAEMRKERQSVFIFPEGTRSYAAGPEMGPFKKGAFHLAVKAGVDIVPVVAGNYWGVLSVKEQRFRAGTIPVKVLPPIPTAHLTAADVDELTRTTREKMLDELVAITESPMGQKATKANVEAGEENLAELATSHAMASGLER
ncbi:1-acyl-sn-glycerol-3-phosphate acyltransferase beta [Imshaugia aleurites]|uniref:1-acyl-sn-glycerol-3-phosphate acyltransferase n=1 Tax=Imshaugia aleurites TaxID=172621 RepID=A0A8H3FV54_9LECA|nr:1-acyl-sn-glycerol-3-phosphate acyltransferase beta [Imshaugia aleurites]